jgi:aspartate racemase
VTRTIGLVGGLTPESTLEYYRLLIRSARERLRDPDPLRNPIVIIYSFDLVVVARPAGRPYGRGDPLPGSARSCGRPGRGALTANTPHLYFEAIQAMTRLELVSIVDATCNAAVGLGLRQPLLLGTRTTMESPMYRVRLASGGIEVLIPGEEGRQRIDEAIYTELASPPSGPELARNWLLEVCWEPERWRRWRDPRLY